MRAHPPRGTQAKIADSRWAIEYEQPAADAYQLNNPQAKVFCANCNVILRVRGRGGAGGRVMPRETCAAT